MVDSFAIICYKTCVSLRCRYYGLLQLYARAEVYPDPKRSGPGSYCFFSDPDQSDLIHFFLIISSFHWCFHCAMCSTLTPFFIDLLLFIFKNSKYKNIFWIRSSSDLIFTKILDPDRFRIVSCRIRSGPGPFNLWIRLPLLYASV